MENYSIFPYDSGRGRHLDLVPSLSLSLSLSEIQYIIIVYYIGIQSNLLLTATGYTRVDHVCNLL